MKNNLKISVVVPVFNGEAYIARCIKSVLEQTYHNWELIVVDDGSRDASAQIVQKFVEEDVRIRLIRQKNRGVSSARNRGIEETAGELLMFLDADDWFEKTAFETVIQYWDDSIQMLLFDYFDVPDNGRKQYRRHFKEDVIVFGTDEEYRVDYLTLVMSGYYTTKRGTRTLIDAPWGKVWKMDLIKRNGLSFPEDVFACEDQIFCVNVSTKIEKARYLSIPIYNYYINSNSVSQMMHKENGERLIVNMINCNRHLKKIFETKEQKIYKSAYYKYIFCGVKIILWWLAEESDKEKKALGRDYCYRQAKQVSMHICNKYGIVDRILLLLCEKRCFWLMDAVVGVRKRIKGLLHIR